MALSLKPRLSVTSGASSNKSTSVSDNDSGKIRPIWGASIKTVFLYPSTSELANNPDGWWSWPGNEFDAEGRQKQYSAELLKMNNRLNADISIEPSNIGNSNDAAQIIQEIELTKPDGLILIMFYHNSMPQADLILEAAYRSLRNFVSVKLDLWSNQKWKSRLI